MSSAVANCEAGRCVDMEPTTEKATARYAQRRPSILAQDFGAGRTQHLKELSDRAPPRGSSPSRTTVLQ